MLRPGTFLLLSLLLSTASALAAPAKQDVLPGQSPSTLFGGMGKDAAEQRQLDEMGRAIERYEEESKEYSRDVQELVEKRYQEKRARLAESYEKAIAELEVVERKERLDAIAEFEEFLRRYPEEPRQTPDVMFRLAELYYERSADDQALAMRAYEEKLKRQDPSKPEPALAEPPVNFTPSIEVYRTLLSRFPGYRLNDGAAYLLGYCLEKQNEFDKGLVAYHQLIGRYPKSRFTTEAWVRIGEYYFDAFNDSTALTKAADAYEHATQNTTHPLYDKALYKLGWTYYRMDRFDDAVGRFLVLADYYQAQAKARGEETVGGDLRAEALQYTAISLADEKWGSLAKAKELFERLGGRPYEADIYRRMGQVFFDQTRHADAIEAFRLVLAKDPLAPDAPQIQQKIVEAYERDRRLEESFAESSKLADNFSPGTAWYEKHRHDPETLSAAQKLTEKSLYSTAIYHHQQALSLKSKGNFTEAKSSFEVAAKAYTAYLERFPRSKTAYEMTFYLAECLYNALRFPEAAQAYQTVRDSTQGVKFFKEATFSAVLAYQKQLEALKQNHQLPDLKALKSSERPEGEKVQPIALAPVEKKFIAASDFYGARQAEDEKAPGIAYKAAELLYAHNAFPEARKRFERIIQTYPKTEVAKFSANLIVESFLVDKDWKSVEDTAARLAANPAVIDPKSDLHKELVKFKLAGRFKLADELMAKRDYDAAAAKYIELVEEAPHHEFADKALNNAAVAYENTRRFDSALKLYQRVYSEYPRSKLADGALFRVAVNAENSYDFDKAVRSYQKLVKDYPKSKDREPALFNAARLLEGQQRYREAAQALTRSAELFPSTDDAPKNIYRAALIYEKERDYKGEIRALQEFVNKYGNRGSQVDLVVDGKKRIGDALQKLGQDPEARRAYELAAHEFDRRRLKPDKYPQAAEAAAQARFQVAEYAFKDFDKLKIGGRGKALERSFKDKRAAVKKVNDAYAEVFPYKRLEWTLAALYRRGFALERFGNTIIETPVPVDVKRLGDEAVAAYQDLLAQQTAALEDKAVESYVTTLAEARKNHISNEWTKRTLESLNRYRPTEYPVLKEPKAALSTDATYPDGLIQSPEGPVRAAPLPKPTVESAR